MKLYTNFEEIDQDLKYLRLKSKIDVEEMKIGIHRGKMTLKDTFSPVTFIANTVGSIIKKTLVLKLVDKLIGIKTVKKQEYED